MHPFPCAAALLLASVLVPAQAERLLAVERAADRAGRDRAYRLLAATRAPVSFTEATPRDVARWLAAATGDRVNFAVFDELAAEPLTLELPPVPLTTVLDILRRHGGVRPVWRSGVVLLRDPEAVREHTTLRIHDVRAATTPIPGFPGPELALSRGGDFGAGFADDPEPAPPVSGFDAERLVDVIRDNVRPESWDREGISIGQTRGVLYVRQTDAGHREVEDLLRQLGAVAPRRVRLETRGRGPCGAAPAPPPARPRGRARGG